jgi:CO dehydrogenase/acetyl-CoA synthase delta subunit
MKMSDLKYLMDHYRGRDDLEVVVCVERAGAIGATPAVSVKSANLGFDWDQGRLVLYPETTLREIDRDEIAALRKNYDELGWSLYKVNNIKRENKQLKEQVELLKQEIVQLKQG